MNRTRYLQQLLASQTDSKAMGKLMKRLASRNMFAEIERLSKYLPNTQEYSGNEDITRAKIAVAWNKKDLKTVYRLIEVRLSIVMICSVFEPMFISSIC